MVVVRSVEDFARKNEGDLRRLMNYKTGIFDKDLVDESIQDFYVKLIETRALEIYDEEAGTFKTYITNLFFWTLPKSRRDNFRVNFDVFSSVTVAGCNSTQKNVDVWDFISSKSTHTVDFEPKKRVSKKTEEDEERSTADKTSSVSFKVDCRFSCPAIDSAKEAEFNRELEEFKRYIKRTEPKNKAERMVMYIDRKREGCLGTDIASMLSLSTAMIRLIKNELKEKYREWKSYHD